MQAFCLVVRHRGDRARTCDLRFWRPTLYQLSYAPRPDEFTGRARPGSSAERVPSRSSTTRPSSSSSARARARDVGGEAGRERQGVAPARAAAELGPERRRRRRRAARAAPARARSARRARRARRRRCRPGAAPARRSVERPAAELEPRRAGHGQDVAADRERVIGRDQRARAPRRLDHDRRLRERRDDAVADGEAPRRRLDARPPLRDDRAGAGDARRERGVAPRVVAVDAAAEHGDRVGRRRRARRRAQAASMPSARPLITLTPGLGQLARERAGEALARRRGRARARPSRPRAPRSASASDSDAAHVQPLRLARAEVGEARGPAGGAALEHADRGASTEPRSARDQRERLGHVLALDCRRCARDRRPSAPAAARAPGAARSGAATRPRARAARARPGAMPRRSSSASSSRAFGVAWPRAACQSRAAATRAATTAVASGRSRLSASGSGASTRTTRSRRSTSGPLSRAR